MDDLFHIFEKLQGIHRTQCLEMILNRLSIINNPFEKITELNGFFNMLKDKYVFVLKKICTICASNYYYQSSELYILKKLKYINIYYAIKNVNVYSYK